MGRKVVDLKKPHRETLTVQASPLERRLTQVIENKFQEIRIRRKQKLMPTDDPCYEMGNKLQQITRLRQSVNGFI